MNDKQRQRFLLRLQLGLRFAAYAAVPVVWVAAGVLFGNVLASILHDAQVRHLYSRDPSSSVPAQAFQDMLANLGVVLSAVGEGGRSMQDVLVFLLFITVTALVLRLIATVFGPPQIDVGAERGWVRSLRSARRLLILTAASVAVLWRCVDALHAAGTGRPVNVAWPVILGGTLGAAVVMSVVMSYLDRYRTSWYCTGTGASTATRAAMYNPHLLPQRGVGGMN